MVHFFWTRSLLPERAVQPRSSRVIVVANEKGGSGKSTIAIHIAVALMKSGQQVATIDLDTRQRSLTRYIENRRSWARHVDRDLAIPDHFCPDELPRHLTGDDEMVAAHALVDLVDDFAKGHSVIVIDTPGHRDYLTQIVHAMADTLITPVNDSFVDFDVLGTVDPETFAVTGSSHYAKMVEEARHQREQLKQPSTDWIVLRNRLSMLGSRNNRLVGEGLQQLAQRLGFRFIDGLSERVIFREFYPRGLTGLDDFNEATLGARPTMSHVAARQEVRGLLTAIRLGPGDAKRSVLAHPERSETHKPFRNPSRTRADGHFWVVRGHRVDN
jgi:chromosome partitioning protein